MEESCSEAAWIELMNVHIFIDLINILNWFINEMFPISLLIQKLR